MDEKNNDIAFIASKRSVIAAAFYALLAMASGCLIVSAWLFFQSLSLVDSVSTKVQLIERYRDKYNTASDVYQVSTEAESLAESLQLIAKTKNEPIDLRVLLAALEAKKPKEIRYISIVYSAATAQCIVGFVAKNSESANKMITGLESIHQFSDVVLRKKSKNAEHEGLDVYAVNVRVGR